MVHIIEWVIAIAACAYLIYKIATYEDYAALGECLRSMGWAQWLAIGLCTALMPVNMALEAWRWQTLMKLPFRESQRQVYYSKLAGLITPWRLGEYPARAMMQGEWKKTLSMGAVGSATMTGAILIAGLLAIAVQPSIVAYVGGSYMYTVGGAMVLLTGVFFLMPKIFRQWADLHYGLLFYSLFQSFIRLVCWCVQLGLVLYALSGSPILDFRFEILDLMVKTPIYYLLVTVTPNVPVVEAGVRGAWAIVVFGTMNAALAGVLLWAINTLLPCAIGLFLRKKQQ